MLAAISALGTIGAATPAPDDRATALLAKHRAYVGWQFGDGSFATLRVSGNVTDEKGKKLSAFDFLSQGLLFNNTYTSLTRVGETEHEGFTGSIFWRSDLNGFTTPVYGDSAKYSASYMLLMHEATSGLAGTFVADKTVDGKPVSVVRVTITNGDPIDLYVDPSTGAYIQATIDPDGAYETTYHILSYADASPGKKMIGSYRVGDSKHVVSFTNFEPNVLVSNDQLHPPAPTASWSFGAPSPYPITLTHDRMLIDATVNGVKGRFILDTGSDGIVLDDRFADRVNATVKGNSTAEMMTGEVKTRLRGVSTISFGGSTLNNALVYSQDFRHEDARGLDWQGYDGLMGFDLFAGAIVKLNVYDSNIVILDPQEDLSSERGLPITVDLSEGVPTIPMTLNKKIPVNAMLDTGNPGIIFFSEDLIKKHGLNIRDCGLVDSLTIGPIVYASEMACESDFLDNSMLLGFDFLKHFDYVFDYPHGRMFMRPNKN